MIARVAPDILVLSGLDHDADGHARRAFAAMLADEGHDLPYNFAYGPNSGRRTGLDMTGDGRAEGPDDTQGYGYFTGQRALAVFARHPILPDASRDFSHVLWRDLPDSLSPYRPGAVMADPARDRIQRLSSTGHWDIAVALPQGGRLHLLIWQAGPPVFGGNTPRNLHRNHDETMFWVHLLNNRLPFPPPEAPFLVIGGSNLDPFDGDGLHDAMRQLLDHPALQDPEPASPGAVIAAQADPASAAHRGPHALDTVYWPQARGPGNLRVSYILPSQALRVTNAGVFWPAPEDPLASLLGESDNPRLRHRLVWVDLARDSFLPGVERGAVNVRAPP